MRKRFIRYLFPPRRLRDRLPLTAKGYRSQETIYGPPPDNHLTMCRALVAANCAPDVSRAWLIVQNEPPGTSLRELIRRYKPHRRRAQPLLRAARRLRRLLWIVVALTTTTTAGAQDPRPKAVALAALDVHECPGMQCAVIGRIEAGGKFYLSGLSDSGWLYFRYWDQDGWVIYDRSTVMLPVALSDLPVITTTIGRLTVSEYAFDPIQPSPNQPYTLILRLRNDSTKEVQPFVIAASFPSGYFAYVSVPVLPPGAAGDVRIPAPGEKNTGRYEIAVILDIEQSIYPMPDPAQRLIIPLNVDRPVVDQGVLTMQPESNLDFAGDKPDLQLSDGELRALGGAAIQIIAPENAHYDGLNRVEGEAIPLADLEGALLGVRTAEGRRGVLRVRFEGAALQIAFSLY